ncbi:MAG TPA: 3-methyl-2-oxobutanoate dehydrogenase subunit VorB [Acidimicrobiales bacterium]|nr:3-methyl-2-oxobutanoate dehydrogenase subunit VorB [Acidimicrobiales bacterium]
MPVLAQRSKPLVVPEYCKGCGRCIASCARGCFTLGTEVNAATGLVPVNLDLSNCNGCGLCFDACPEPYGLSLLGTGKLGTAASANAPEGPADGTKSSLPSPDITGTKVPLPPCEPIVMKGTSAAAVGAVLAGCRHVFGYPITPSTEGAEMMARILPQLGGVFLQAVSEVATVNMMYGTGGAGTRCLTFTSSPGFSLMLEGISYMVGAEVPAVFVNIMRGGPGLGNIGPEQADIKLACRGLGHGNTHAISFAPASPQEMLDLTMLSFDLAFKYRNPVLVLGDGYLGQMVGKVQLPDAMVVPATPGWAVHGDGPHRGNLICSLELDPLELERHNEHLNEKYHEMTLLEQRAERYYCDDASVVLVACNTPSQLCKGAVQQLRGEGVKAGLLRPVTIWPFPIDDLCAVLSGAEHLVVVEASSGQLEDEMRLALSHAGVHAPPPVSHVRRMGGVLPTQDEITEHVHGLKGVK